MSIICPLFQICPLLLSIYFNLSIFLSIFSKKCWLFNFLAVLETSECQIKNRLNSIIWRHTDVHIMSIGRPKIPCFERCENLGRSDLKSMWTLKLYYFCTIFIVYHTSLDKFNKWWKCYKCIFKKLREGTADGVLDPLSFFVILTIFHVIKNPCKMLHKYE